MMENDDARAESLDLQNLNLIDELCDEFEDSWKQGKPPDIIEFLQRTTVNLRETLFVELVKVDIEWRSESGQQSSIDEYAKRFPEFEGILSQLKPDGEPIQPETDKKPIQRDEHGNPREIGCLRQFEKAGTGTFGVVWKAWDSQLEREVAVKLPTERSLGREYEAEFQREAKAAAMLNHPGIVRVIGFSTEYELAFIVYEFIDGMTLRQWMKENTITPQVAANFCARIADALAHAHENRVIHRDLKPSNVLINRAGKPVITDFGFAKLIDSASTIAGSGVTVGTWAYMSPEQAEGKSKQTQAPSDIYSVGAILYEMLAGKLVFEGEPLQILQKIISEPAPSLAVNAPGVHRDLRTICHKCLEKNPKDRYLTAAALAADLRSFENNERIKGQTVSRTKRAARFVLKHWRIITTAFSPLLIFLAVLAAFRPWGLFRMDPEPAGGNGNNADVASQNPAQAATERVFSVLVQTNPPGAHVAVVPRNPVTEEVDLVRIQGTMNVTPVSFNLTPGLYQVRVFLPDEPDRSHDVIRTVPAEGVTIPSGVGKPREFQIDGDKLIWPVIEIPPANITTEMVFFDGDPVFPVGDSSSETLVEVRPFYVFPRKFSYGDFLKLRPREDGNVPNRPASQQPPLETMPQAYELAAHWAEESGGRLLSEYEYEYLAALAIEEKATGAEGNDREGPEPNSEAEGELKGRILRVSLLRDILSGDAEWTGSLPHHPPVWPNPQIEKPDDYRVFRRAFPEIDLPLSHHVPKARSWAGVHEFRPDVGFRIARPER